MGWCVVAGPASKDIASRVAAILDLRLIDVELRVFPDGESKVRLLAEPERGAIVIQSTYPPVDTNTMRALFIAHKLRSMGSRVVMVMPYLGYSRQDREFLKGEAVSLMVVARLLQAVGIERLLTVDIHSTMGLGYMPFQAHSVSAVPLLAESVMKEYRPRDPLIVSPDLGGRPRAEAFASIIGAESYAMLKARDRVSGEVRIEAPKMDVKGRDAILIDDIISTGGSIANAARILKAMGANRVLAACTHALLAKGAMDRIGRHCDDLIATNTVPSPVSRVDVSPAIAGYLETVL